MLQTQPSARATLGRVGLPASIRELAAKRWDAIIVGGGHNGPLRTSMMRSGRMANVTVSPGWNPGAAGA